MSFVSERQDRILLAAFAAEATLRHPSGGSSRSLGEMTLREVYTRVEVPENQNIESNLRALVEAGYLRKRNTGHSGYGDSWIEGMDVWAVTQKGLVYLWTGVL